MIINLKPRDLEDIVKDGIKEMIRSVAGRHQDRKRSWYKTVKGAILEYQRKVMEEFLPVLVKDFSTSQIVKFQGGKMSQDDIEVVKNFMEMVDKSNIRKLEKELMSKIREVPRENAELDNKLDEIKKVVEERHQWILTRIDLYVRSMIKETLYINTVKRSQIEVMLYNFVEGEVPEAVRSMLKNGMNSVPSMKLTKEEVDKRVQDALLEYLMRFGKRNIYGHGVIQAANVEEWIRKVKIFNMDEDSRKFVESIEEHYHALKTELDLVYTDVKLDTKEELVKKLEKEGCVLVNCDKSMGMSLFTLKTMRKADGDLMKQLGAVRLESPLSDTKAVIIKIVKAEIYKFEHALDTKQREYMDATCEDRYLGMKKISFPFLKSQHKVHKMNEEQIRNKDLRALKFRPVVDSKLWLTKDYSGMIMQMMRELSSKLLEKSGPVFQAVKPKDGWRFAVDVRENITEEEFDINLTADIQEAYTNINDVMIKKAIEVVGGFVKYEKWKIELMKRLIDLVLEQNYVETSVGVFQFKKVLPMGYKLSGEALDLVALSEEMMTLRHLGDEIQHEQEKLGELKNYPSELVDNDVQNELSMSKGVKDFKRYVDDTYCKISGGKKEVLDGVLAVGYMYPGNLVISMNLNIWNSTFLDVFVWKNLLSDTVSTVMKRECDVPVGHIRRGSSHPEKYKLQSLLGEMLRGRRLASDEDLVDHSDKCIGHEFQSLGYSRWEVQTAMEEAKKKVENKYSGQFVKIPDEDEGRRFFSYGGGLVHNKNYRYGEILVRFIDSFKPEGEPGIVLLPDMKVKNLAFTRKRYLERQEEDKVKHRS